MSPWVQGLRSASVVAEQTSPGRLATHLPHGSDCCGAGAHGSRSRLRLGRCRTDVPPDVLQPVFRKASVIAWQAPHGSKVFAPLRSAQSRHPPDVLRSPLRFGRCRTDVPRTSCNPSSARFRLLRGRRPMGPRSRLCNPSSALKWGKLNYTDFVQNCILDQKERTSL